jgi:Flp pilus assembly protein TadG
MRRFASNRGQAAVELALVLPVLLLLVFGITEFGRGLEAYLAVQNGAWVGARLGITGASDADIRQAVLQATSFLDPSQETIDITPPEGSRNTGDSLTVRVTYQFPVAVPLIAGVVGGNTLTLVGSATMRVE